MVEDTIRVHGIPVYSSSDEVPHTHDEEDPNLVTFLKEQQWAVPFGVERVGRQTLSRTLVAHGETHPAAQNQSLVSAPLAGIILSSMNRDWPVAGQQVSRGQTLLRLSPAIQSEDGENYAEQFISAHSRLELAENNLRRSERLFANEAIPESEMEQARMEHRQARIRFQTIHETMQIDPDAIDAYGEGADSYRFELNAPIDGTIVELYAGPGMQVRAGDPLFRIADLSRIWLKVQLPAHRWSALETPESVVFSIQGSDRTLALDEVGGKLVSRGAMVDPQTRTVSLTYEIPNEGSVLQTGLFTIAEIDTERKADVLAVPESALVEEDGTYSVFVQHSGEWFEKREVAIGIRNRGRVEIISGLEEGERIVTVNAYRVKLASLSTEAPAHGHSH
jgi:membrane fusion protein, heavy metal efflux system